MAVEHREAFSNLIRERSYTDIEKAWKVYKVENEIDEPETKAPVTKTPVKPVEQAIPATTQRKSGSAPTKSEPKDMIDDILSTPGF